MIIIILKMLTILLYLGSYRKHVRLRELGHSLERLTYFQFRLKWNVKVGISEKDFNEAMFVLSLKIKQSDKS
jgi:hypothetical protein